MGIKNERGEDVSAIGFSPRAPWKRECFMLFPESQQVEKFIIYNKTFLVSGKFNSAQTSVQI